MTRLQAALWALAILAAVVGCQPAATSSATPSAATVAQIDPLSGLPFVDQSDLPPEAATTIALITRGGPFPYSHDGVVFQNREAILPARGSGYYREYTVDTPGSADRGARRIVTGSGSEMYYTDDHYSSFRRIRP